MCVVLERRGKGGGEREGARTRTKKRTRERMYLSPIQRMKFKQVACVCASVCACVRACVRAREQVRTCVLRTRTNTHCVSARCVCAHTCKWPNCTKREYCAGMVCIHRQQTRHRAVASGNTGQLHALHGSRAGARTSLALGAATRGGCVLILRLTTSTTGAACPAAARSDVAPRRAPLLCGSAAFRE